MSEQVPKLVLHNLWRSSCSWRVRIALNVKKIPYTYVSVNHVRADQRSENYRSLNPVALVPTLVVNDKVVITESLAIIEYLEEAFPNTQKLLPKDPAERAIVRSLASHVSSNIQPLQNVGNLQAVHPDDETAQAAYARSIIRRGFDSLEKLLEKYSGKYTFGDEVTLADTVIPSQVNNAIRKYGFDMSEYPKIKAVNENLAKIPEFVAADAFHQPDTPKELLARD